MKVATLNLLAGLLCSFWCLSVVQADDFFQINRIQVHTSAPEDDMGLWEKSKEGQKEQSVFIPCIEINLQTKEDIKFKDAFLKVHFFDNHKRLLASIDTPEPAANPGEIKKLKLPVVFSQRAQETVFMPIPPEIADKDWTAIAVFGDDYGATAKGYPHSISLFMYDYAERELVEKRGKKRERKPSMDPVIEHVVKTGNAKQPKITLFLRPPLGVTEGSETQGVLALCVLANRTEDIKRKLQSIETGDELSGLIGFADKHQLAIIAWGSTKLWDPKMSYDELKRQINRDLDDTFDDVANAWERGVSELSEEYGLPEGNFLLHGASGAAQYACRLVLRKPHHFLALHAHIPSSFDEPTEDANTVLWLLTTGEKEGGYPAACRFYNHCRDLDYPIIFKAVPGLGHRGHPLADRLGLYFFEYALSLTDEKEHDMAEMADSFNRFKDLPEPWPDSLRKPEFVGDFANQDYFDSEHYDVILPEFRVNLPNKPVAEAWSGKK